MSMVEILSLISGGGMSITEMAEKLGIDKDLLMDRITTLERMGYLRKFDMEGRCEEGRCRDCPLSRSCGGNKATNPTIYVLSEKGKRSLER